MKRLLQNLVQEDSGQDMIEYALVSTLLVLSLLAVMRSYRTNAIGVFNGVENTLSAAIS